MLTLCMNPGKVHDWSLLNRDVPIVSSDCGAYKSKTICLDTFEELVELAKADKIQFVSMFCVDIWVYAGEYDLYFIADYETEEELKADFDDVINFLKDH